MTEPILPSGLGLMLTGSSAREEVELAQRAEAAGFELALEWEFFHRHAFVRLAAVAQATTRIRIGTGIANAFTRAPLLHAIAALDLDELSGGRMTLGLGSATRRMNEEWWGVPFAGAGRAHGGALPADPRGVRGDRRRRLRVLGQALEAARARVRAAQRGARGDSRCGSRR